MWRMHPQIIVNGISVYIVLPPSKTHAVKWFQMVVHTHWRMLPRVGGLSHNILCGSSTQVFKVPLNDYLLCSLHLCYFLSPGDTWERVIIDDVTYVYIQTALC